MNEQFEMKQDPPHSQHIVEILKFILRYKWLIMISAVISAGVAAFVAFSYMPNKYTASVNAVPPKKSSSMDGILGSVSSTLKDIGLTRVMGKKSDGYEFMVLLNSRTLRDSLIKKYNLYQRYDIQPGKHNIMYDELSTRLDISSEQEGNYVISYTDEDPKMAADIANYCIDLANVMARELDQRENQVILRQFDEKIQATNATITQIQDSLSLYAKESLMYSPLDQAKAAANAVAETKAQALQAEIKQSIIASAMGEDDPLTVQQKQVASELRAKALDIENKPGFLGDFSLRNAPAAATKYLRMYTELETMMKVKAFLLPSYEQTKLDQVKESYSLYVLDKAIPPSKKSGPKRSLIIAGAFVAGGLVVLGLLLLVRGIQTIRRMMLHHS
ncbi:MAG: hypothetical protein JNL32_05640 [Candidatus Kapabacteria bacterium]|nr:hypothetical protein [Candidatus Kapabacteria bacterium]